MAVASTHSSLPHKLIASCLPPARRCSQEIMKHKQAMAALQSRIASMQSQLLIGGQKIEDTPQFRCDGVHCSRAGFASACLNLHMIPCLCKRCGMQCKCCSAYSWRPPARSPSRTLLAKEQARIRQQYEERLRELEVERQGMAEDKAQASCSCGLMAWDAGQPS